LHEKTSTAVNKFRSVTAQIFTLCLITSLRWKVFCQYWNKNDSIKFCLFGLAVMFFEIFWFKIVYVLFA